MRPSLTTRITTEDLQMNTMHNPLTLVKRCATTCSLR